jgi:hypothetical protein
MPLCREGFMIRLLVPAILLLAAVSGCAGLAREIVIPRADIQRMAEKRFPVKKHTTGADVELSSPEVFFQGNDIGISLRYGARLLMGELKGDIAFTCRPVYRPEDRSFYMSDFTITRITVDGAGGLENDNIRGWISSALNGLFRDHALYTLKQDDFRQDLAAMVLKEVTVRGDDLVLRISF